MSRLTVLLAGVAAAILAGACGVPSDAEPRAIGRDDIPVDLLEPAASTTSTTAPAPTAQVRVFFLRDDRLVPVAREVRAPATIASRLDALQTGPTDAEVAAGIRSGIVTDPAIAEAAVSGVTARVELAESFGSVHGPDQVLAVAQIVYTATEIPGLAGVAFFLGGRPVEVPTLDGTLKGTPLTRADYPALAP